MFKGVWDKLLSILFPQICLVCKEYLQDQSVICQACFKKVEIHNFPYQVDTDIPLFAVTPYESREVKTLIQSFKYGGIEEVIKPIGDLLGLYLEVVNLKLFLPEDTVIIPIPLHRSRERERGFNQSLLISEVLSEKLNFKTEKDLLKRNRKTKRQSDMKLDFDRRKNVEGCFTVAGDVRDKSVLLVDDIYTSGSTIKEAIKELRQSGARDISVLVFAKAR